MPMTINQERCLGCAGCVNFCPMRAIQRDEERRVAVREAVCVGCGLCAQLCPAGAIAPRADEHGSC